MRRRFPLRNPPPLGNFSSTMVRIRLVILMLLAFLWFGNQSCPAQWQVVKYKNREYVTLRSFCEFYGFRYEPLAEKKGTTLLGQRGQVKLALKSRDVEVNGVKYNLSFPVESNGRDYIISKTDVNSLFEPVLRPYRVRRKERATTIIIDAGHGGSDSGAIGRTGTEKKIHTRHRFPPETNFGTDGVSHNHDPHQRCLYSVGSPCAGGCGPCEYHLCEHSL